MDKYIKHFSRIIMIIAVILMFGIDKVYAETSYTTTLTFDNDNIIQTIPGTGYNINGTTLEITKAGTYRVTGSSNEGNIIIKKGISGVNLIFDNLSLTSSRTAPVSIKKADEVKDKNTGEVTITPTDVTIKLVGWNTLIDNEDPHNEFSTDLEISDLFGGAGIKIGKNSKLTLGGYGHLTIKGNTKNGIKGGEQSKIIIESGYYDIEADNHGIANEGPITINEGVFAIEAEAEGIKISADEGGSTENLNLTINGGGFDINAGEDGIQVLGNIYVNNNANIKIYAILDGIQTRNNFYMTNGELEIHTFEGSDPTSFAKDLMSAKGIKASPKDEDTSGATNIISITGGIITIDSSDDAIHSEGSIIITRGTLNLKSGDDAVHANTKLTVGTQGGLERDPEITIPDSYEGLEAGNLYIYSGKIYVVATDDGINAAGGASSGEDEDPDPGSFNPSETGNDLFAIYIYGGEIYVNANGDGLDSNGSIYLYGGTQIVYHEDADGSNSSLDRDGRLIIDGATFFSAGGIAESGIVSAENGGIGSSQKYIIDNTTYPANTKIAVLDGNGNKVFNEQIIQKSKYMIYTSPTLDEGSSITTTTTLEEDYNQPFTHTWMAPVITQEATPDTPGIMTYTCEHGVVSERKTYFFVDELNFNIYNKTNGVASVTINDGTGDRTETSDFTVHDNTGVLTIRSSKEIMLMVTTVGNTTEFAVHNPTSVTGSFGDSSNPAVYTYKIENTSSFDMYVVLKGDVNLDGIADNNDAISIRNSKLSKTNDDYETLPIIGEMIGDVNNDGLVSATDALLLKNNMEIANHNTVNKFELTNNSSASNPILVDGENNGEVTVELKATGDISFTALEAYFSPSSEHDIDHPYFMLTSLEKVIENGDSVEDVNNGLIWLIKPDGYTVNNGGIIYRATFSVDKDTPTGYYPIHLGISAVTAPGSDISLVFPVSTTVRVKGATDPYIALFEKDSGVASIDIFNKQEYGTPSETDVDFAYARNADTGIIDVSGDTGQINFRINLEDGYILKNITIENIKRDESDIDDHYKNIKGPGDTKSKNVYRLTKVSGDLKVTIETKLDDKYVAYFTKDEHVTSVDVFYTKAYEDNSSLAPDEFNVTQAYIRDKDSGNIDISGSGQVNFRINVEDGYFLDKVKVTGIYENKNANNKGDGNYKITKVAGDLQIEIKTKPKAPIEIAVSGYNESYVYTGDKIKPEVIVTKVSPEPEKVLEKDVDYSVDYDNNKKAGTADIIIKSLSSSKHDFEDTTVHFEIEKYPLTSDNVIAPESIYYTGETLAPNVVVKANNKVLTLDEDYTITFTNLDGNVGDTIVATVKGKKNYKGTVDNINILIKNKSAQDLAFSETELVKTYGENYTLAATRTTGDGIITYESDNLEVATVDNSGNVTLVGSGNAVITAKASETEDYAPALASYTLTVNKAPLVINDVKVSNKNYDGNTNATVIRVDLVEQVNSDRLVKGTDFTAVGVFEDEEIGTDKDVTVTVTLSEDTSKKYSLNENVVQSTARITLEELYADNVTLDETNYTYDGNEKKPNVTVKIGDKTLIEGTDYEIEYVDNTNAGTAKVLVRGKGNYFTEDRIEKEFTIGKLAINPVIGAIVDQQYTGSEIKPQLTVTFDAVTLEADKDYVVTYTDNINVGIAHASIAPKEDGNYTFETTGENTKKDFNIIPHTLTNDDITLEYTVIKYDGTDKEPRVTVTIDGNELAKDTDYTVTYADNKEIGTEAKVTVTATSANYTGSVTLNFEISEKEVLTISGIPDNQSKTYTGNPIALDGEVIVSGNTGNITASDLTIKYYDSNDNETDKPKDVGSYYVVYSYDKNDYVGEFKVNFEITKKESTAPSINNLVGIIDRPLSTVTLAKLGLSWTDSTTVIIEGKNNYPATYTENNDSKNYTTINLDIPVTGKNAINITTSVNGTGGAISASETDVLNGETREIKFTPDEGYKLDKVTINGKTQAVTDNRITIKALRENLNIIVTFKKITYKMKIIGNNVDASPYGLLNVEYNDSKTITIKPASGYVLTSVLVNGVENINLLVDDKLTINNIKEEYNIIIDTKKIEYMVIEGAGQEVEKGNEATFKINADYSVFNPGGKVYVDNKVVNSANYIHKSGSTVITFKKEFINVLAVGDHTFKVVFNDGGEASTTFTILKSTNTITPITSDDVSSNVWLLVISSIILLLIIIYVVIRIIKKNKNKKKA